MSDFSAQVFQNEFMPPGDADMHAVVRFTCETPPEAAGGPVTGATAEILLIDCSGSMAGAPIKQAAEAAKAALQAMPDGCLFAVVAGTHQAAGVYPPQGMVVMDDAHRAAALREVSLLRADGGTAMGTWLRMAKYLFSGVQEGVRCHAILLTDGRNEHEKPADLDRAIAECAGSFQADCRGVGDRWEVDEVRRIAAGLLGGVGLVRSPEELAAEFVGMTQDSMSRSAAEVRLRVWAPQGAQLVTVRQVFPELLELTERRTDVNPLTGDYPTTSWKAESRDYHLTVRLPARTVGEEQLAARVQLVIGDEVQAQGLAKARWSDDETATSRIDPQVAHYTGRAEMASAIQDGLAAKQAGDEERATELLKRAAVLAAEADDEQTTTRLKRLIEIESDGTVRLKRSASKLDEMDLDVASTKTERVRGTGGGS